MLYSFRYSAIFFGSVQYLFCYSFPSLTHFQIIDILSISSYIYHYSQKNKYIKQVNSTLVLSRNLLSQVSILTRLASLFLIFGWHSFIRNHGQVQLRIRFVFVSVLWRSIRCVFGLQIFFPASFRFGSTRNIAVRYSFRCSFRLFVFGSFEQNLSSSHHYRNNTIFIKST